MTDKLVQQSEFLQAAEYVLGTLDARERADFVKRGLAETGLVRDCECKFAPLAELAEPVEPSPDLWLRIERDLDAARATSSPATSGNVVALRRSVVRWRVATGMTGAMAAALTIFAFGGIVAPPERARTISVAQSQPQPAPQAEPLAPPRENLTDVGSGKSSVTNGVATSGLPADSSVVAASAARDSGAGLVVGGVRPPQSPTQAERQARTPAYVAALTRADDPVAFVVRVDSDTRAVTAKVLGPPPPAGMMYAFWALVPGRAPQAIGCPSCSGAQLTFASDVALARASVAVSVEPAAARPPERPTSAFVFQGALVAQ